MRRYSAKRVDNQIVVTPDIRGKYRASASIEIKDALSKLDYKTTTAEVLIGNKWLPLGKRARKGKGYYSTLGPRKPLSRWLKILRILHLYKDPLDVLIYRGR